MIFLFVMGFPLAAVLQRGFFAGEVFHFSSLLVPVIFFSLLQASLSLLASLVLGGAFGFVFAREADSRLKGLLLSVFSLPGLSVVGGALALSQLFGFSFGLPLVVATHAYLNAPWIALAVIDARQTFPKSWGTNARSLGATPRQVFWKLFLPWTFTRVLMAGAQVFAFCLMSFAIVLLLGGGPPVSTLETEIYAQVRGGGLALETAAQFAAAQLLLAGLPLFFVSLYRARNHAAIDTTVRGDAAPNVGHAGKWIARVWLGVPLLTLAIGVINRGEVFHSEFWSVVVHDPSFHSALLLSLVLSTGSAVTALIFSWLFAFSSMQGWSGKLLRFLAAIPIGVSPLVLGLGILLVYSTGPFEVFDAFEGSRTAIILLQSMLLIPFGLRFFQPLQEESSQAARRDLRLAARSLGASARASWWKLEWPQYRNTVGDFFRLAWVWSFMDLAIASFFGSEDLVTLPLWISQQMARYQFAVAETVLFAMTLLSVGVLIFGRRGRRLEI